MTYLGLLQKKVTNQVCVIYYSPKEVLHKEASSEVLHKEASSSVVFFDVCETLGSYNTIQNSVDM